MTDFSTDLMLIAAAFVASLLSGVYGMAGGLVLMAIYLALLPVPKVMVLHGLVMLVANVGRASLNRADLMPSVVISSLIVAPLLGALFVAYTIVLPKSIIYILAGLTSLVVWLPKDKLNFSFHKKRHAAIPAAISTSTTLLVGAAGPIVDALFWQSAMTRQQIMANKAFLQVMSHSAKIIIYGGLSFAVVKGQYSLVLLIGSFWAALAGTWVGSHILARMSNDIFRSTSKYIITAIAAYYIAMGSYRLWQGLAISV
jgi:uncharacterized protein